MRALLARGVCCSFAALALALCSSSSLSSVLSLSLSLLLPLSLLLLLLLLLSLLLLLLLLSLIKLSLLLLLFSRVVSGNTRGGAAGRRGELAALDAPCCSAVCAACNAGKLSIMQLQASLFCAISGQLVPTVMRSVLMPAYLVSKCTVNSLAKRELWSSNRPWSSHPSREHLAWKPVH